MLGVGGVDLFCGRGHLQTTSKQPPNKGNQGKSREIKRSQEESRGVKGSQGAQCEPRKNEMK